MLKIASIVILNATIEFYLATLVSTVSNLKTFLAILKQSLKSTTIDLDEFCLNRSKNWMKR